ncbi:MAG TPA: BamA/TamA family outer membrane protein [Anaeromyxobacteraceae bacterium]|nr:BamA/TamA family outer membrane protein [Anaeromyxobacteraceae bacterium]
MITRTRLLAALLLVGAPAAARPQPYDPRLRWLTLETPHFQLHYYAGEEALARRTAGALERAHELMQPFLPWDPGRTQVVLADNSDDENGSATPFPYNTIRLIGTPPDSLSELNDYSDWLLSLSAHEYTHILHLGRVSGIPAGIDAILGPIWLPNAMVPSWLSEGLAVLHESGPGHGRNASALFDMYARAMVTEGGLFPLPEVSNLPLDWPLGTTWYLLGGRFLSFLCERYGPGAIAAFVDEQGRWVWPFAIGVVAEHHFGGKDFQDLWREFAAELAARYAAQLADVRSRPVTAPNWLTRRGAQVLHPRWAPDGSFIAYWDEGLDGPQGLRRVTAEGQDLGLAAEVNADGTFALRSPREAIVAIADYYDYYWFYGDLYRLDLETGRRERLTRGERATEPDVLPGGEFVAYVARVGPGEMALKRLWLSTGRTEVLFRRAGSQVYHPSISPDGRRIAFELQADGRRDIVVWEAGCVAWVTNDDAIDTGPSWMPDGRLLFSSDRSGIYDVYVFDPASPDAFALPEPAPPAPLSVPEPATFLSLVPPLLAPAEPLALAPRAPVPVVPGRVRQVTNSEMGALEPEPSPDGRRLAYVSYSRAGYDLAWAPIDESTWTEARPAGPRPAGITYDESPEYPSHPYDPLPTLRPFYWLPTFGWDAAGFTLGALTSGADVVGLHSWALTLSWSFGTASPVYDLAYVGSWLRTPLVADSNRYVAYAPGLTGVLEEVWTPLRVSVLAPVRELYETMTLSFGWSGTFFRAINPPPGALPLRNGFRSMVSGSVSYSDARQFVNSISNVMGIQATLAGGLTSPALGSDYNYALAQAAFNGYLRVPWTEQVVLALHLSVGTSQGDFGGQVPFSLGGVPPPNVAQVLLTALGFAQTGAQPDQLRGYPEGIFTGSHLTSGTLELRFPIVAPQWGISTWPVYLRRISGALFVDSGIAWVPVPEYAWWQRVRLGAGGEARFELVVGFVLPLVVRVGIGQGLGAPFAPGHPHDPYAETELYVTLGDAF